MARVQQFGERIDVPTLESWRVRLAEANLTFGALRDIAIEGAALHEELEALPPQNAVGQVGSGGLAAQAEDAAAKAVADGAVGG